MEFEDYEIPIDSDIEDGEGDDAEFRDTFEGAIPNSQVYDINGIKIQFPFKAYDCQKQMMTKIIEAVNHEGRGKNCLLESPTGTGKTLSILCSLLAWRKHRQKSIQQTQKKECKCRLFKKIEFERKVIESQAKCDDSEIVYNNYPQQSHSKSQKQKCSNSQVESQKDSLKKYCDSCKFHIFHNIMNDFPKIIYASRTHSQIAGVIKQLKKTEYKTVKMSILSSRKQTCIFPHDDPKNQKSIDLDDQCKTLRENFYSIRKRQNSDTHGCATSSTSVRPSRPDGIIDVEEIEGKKTCEYYCSSAEEPERYEKLSRSLGDDCWDIEDLIREGKECKVCPYYGARILQSVADIVFCPYNYITSPTIRNAVSLNLENAVVVLDEAHNIETACRDATSKKINLKKLDEVRKGIDELIYNKNNEGITFMEKNSDGNSSQGESDKALRNLEKYSKSLLRMRLWIRQKSLERANSFDGSNDEVVQAEEFINKFEYFGFGPETLSEHGFQMEYMKDVKVNYPTVTPEEERHQISRDFISFIKKLIRVLYLLYQKHNDGHNYTVNPDYKVVFSVHPQKAPPNSPAKSNGGRNFGSPQAKRARITEAAESGKCSLSILCLNPAIGFKDIRNSVHTLIVTSGTLSPLSSFSQELETDFPIELQANHVIPKTNAFICSVSQGLRGQHLYTRKENWNKNPYFQDNIGESIFEITRTVSNGILVFFPSYECMNVMERRWGEFPTGNTLISKLRNKSIELYWETSDKSKDAPEFSRNQINHYKELTKTGRKCIFFGVFRGKLSEGTDFTDNEARAVVTVGIPLLPTTAPEIFYKREYNEKKHKTNPNYLDGSEWYTVGAMRAFNQALGRCIRHVNDWGTIIMLDSRISPPGISLGKFSQYKDKLPSWVKAEGLYKGNYNNFNNMMLDLKAFFDSKNLTSYQNL